MLSNQKLSGVMKIALCNFLDIPLCAETFEEVFNFEKEMFDRIIFQPSY